jgi:4-amino-4-deoxy-L-arabinose transferase-like glycosyltransferase
MRLTLLAAAILGLYLLFFHGLAARDLWSSHEARAAMDAQTLLDTNDWSMPALFDGTPELQKPPLFYWLVALVASARGGTVDALSVRLPATISALLCLLLLVFLGVWRGRFRPGVIAAMLLATTLSFPTLARTGRIDMPLTLMVSVVIVAHHLASRSTNSRATVSLLLFGYLALAGGILLKGPIALVLPGAVLLVQAMIDRRPGWRGLWWGIPLVLLLTVPWFMEAHRRTSGAFTHDFFWFHNVMRGLGGSQLRSHPWWSYGPMLAWGFLPWSLLLPVAGWWCWSRKAWRDDAELRLGLIWLLTILAVLSCAHFKRADYLLPAYPGGALFLGCVFNSWIGAWKNQEQEKAEDHEIVIRSRYTTLWIGAGMTLVAALCCLGWVVYVEWILPREELHRECGRFAQEIRQLAPAPESVTLFRTEAHTLAFHLGRPQEILIEWRNLADRLAKPGYHFVVMPPEWLKECRETLPGIALDEVLRNTTLAGGWHERPLVLLRCRIDSPR